MCSLVHIGKENTGLLTLKRNNLTRKPTRKPLPPLEFDECYSHHFLDMIMQNKKMHVKEIYVIFIHLFDSGILLIIDLNKKLEAEVSLYRSPDINKSS